MIKLVAVYLDFEGAKNIQIIQVLIWDFKGCWSLSLGFDIFILIWIWSLVFDTHDPNFGSLS